MRPRFTDPTVEAGPLVPLVTSCGVRGGENCGSSKSKRGPAGTPKSIAGAVLEVAPASPGGTAAGEGDTALSQRGSTELEDSFTTLDGVGAGDAGVLPGAAAIDVLVELESVGAASTAADCCEFAAEAEPSSTAAVPVVGGRGTMVDTKSIGSDSAIAFEDSGTVVSDTELGDCEEVGFAVVATVVGAAVVGAAVIGAAVVCAAVVGAAVVGAAVVATGAELPDSKAPMSVAPPAGRLAPR